MRAEGGRSLWASGLSVFCLGTLIFLVWRDLTIPEVRDVEVWLGFELRGAAAVLTAPLHWSIFAAGAWGFWHSRPWVWPWAAVYACSIALSHLIWNLSSASGGGWCAGVWQFGLFSLPAVGLLWARPAACDDPGPK